MKKLILALLLAVSGVAYADDPTATPTFTPTFTPTPSFTPQPAAKLDTNKSRIVVYPQDLLQTDGISQPLTYSAAGAAEIWLAQSQSRTAAVLSTGSAKCRWQMVVPNDYKRGLIVWAYASATATAQATTVTLNVMKHPLNGLQSARVAYLGSATEVTARWPGLDLPGTKTSRFPIPMSSSVQGNVKPGDLLSFDLTKVGAVTTDLYLFAIEMEYEYAQFRKP